MSRRTRAEAILYVPGLRVSSDVLDQTIPAIIGGQSLRATFPVVDAVGGLDAPSRVVQSASTIRLGRIPGSGWGYQNSEGRFRVEAVHISFLCAVSGAQDPADSSEFSELANAARPWVHQMNDWLSAWLRLPSDSLTTELGTIVRSARTDGSTAGLGAEINSVSIANAPAADLNQVRSAVARASSGRSIPLEHELLLSARNALHKRDLRRSVIDAATAVEVALAMAIEDQVSAVRLPRAFADAAIKSANGALGLYDAYLALGNELTQSRNRVLDRLAGRRNAAAHAGLVPTQAEASQALAVAQAVVDESRPLPAP